MQRDRPESQCTLHAMVMKKSVADFSNGPWKGQWGTDVCRQTPSYHLRTLGFHGSRNAAVG